MKNIIKRITSFLLGIVTIGVLSSCDKFLEESTAESLPALEFSEVDQEVKTTSYIEVKSEDIVEPEIKPKMEAETITLKIDDDKKIVCSDQGFAPSCDLQKQITKTINNFNVDDISFCIYDLGTGTSISYNEQSEYNGACIVKPGVVLYLLTLCEEGKLDIYKTIKYPGNVVSGSGYLNGYYNGYQAKNGQEFSILELMFHTLYYSDNNAYRLLYRYLIDNGYYEDYKLFMYEIGAPSFAVTEDLMWSRTTNVTDGINLILSINNFIDTSTRGINVDKTFVDGNNLAIMSDNKELTYGNILYWMMINGKYDYLEKATGNLCLTKTGFVSMSGSLSCRNDISLCYGENPYALCLLTRKNDEDLRKKTVNELLKLLNELMKEYNIYISDSNRLILK